MGWWDVLEHLKGALRLTDRQIAALEKRKGFRVTRTVALKGVRASGEKIDMLGTNFGPGGMRVETACRLKKDEEIMVKVSRPPAERAFSLDSTSEEGDDPVPVRVCWCRGHKKMLYYESGVAFAGNKAENHKAAARFLLQDCRLGLYNPKEKRKAPRVAIESMKVLFTTPDGTIHRQEVRDLAIGGALIESSLCVDRGTPLTLKIFLDPGMPTLDCRGTVVRCTKGASPSEYELGVTFEDVPRDHAERLVATLAKRLKGQ